jgi:hypothetical protein
VDRTALLERFRTGFAPEKGYDPNDLENGLSPRDMAWFDLELA